MKMNPLLPGFLLALMTTAGCVREETGAVGETFDSIPVVISFTAPEEAGETRSVIVIDDDDIRKVSLFVFDKSTGKICLDASGRPFTTERTCSSFNWELPCHADGTPLEADIYTICNYGETVLPLTDASLTASDLDKWCYRISGIHQLEQGMPMGGISHVTLLPTTRSLVLQVDKLFACFYFTFDLSDLEAAGKSLQALHLTTHQVNTAVHWFHRGDRAAEVTDLDYATEADLHDLAIGGNAYIYVPENLQGSIPGASGWRDVLQDLGPRVSRCTYVDICVKVLDPDGMYENRNFQVYLGGDMVSDFDIPRNGARTIRIRIPADNPVPEFTWDRKQISLEPGESREVGYQTTIPLTRLRFQSDDPGCTVASPTLGTAVITVGEKVPGGSVILVEGGDLSVSSSTLKVFVRNPAVLSGAWESEPSFVGYSARLCIEGLKEGETLTEVIPSHPKSIVRIDSSVVQYVPGGTGNECLLIRTSLGRELPVETPGAILPVLTAEPTVRLSLDGTAVYPDLCYRDPATGRLLDAFDPDFFDRYLRVSRSFVKPVGSYPPDLVRTACTDSRIAVFSYGISSYVPSSVPVAEVTVSAVDYEGLSTNLQALINPVELPGEDLGSLHDYQLIPAYGERSEEETEVLSLQGSWTPSLPGIAPESILFPLTVEGLDVSWSNGPVIRFTVRSDGSPGIGTISVQIRNRQSGETLSFPLFQVEKHLHLAIGGVRSSVRSHGLSQGEFGSRQGTPYTYFLGAADFASRYLGNESNRFSDWPSEARALITRFEQGGDLADYIQPGGPGEVFSSSAGYTTVYLSTAGVYGGSPVNGIRVQQYAVHCFASVPDPSVLSPYHRIGEYDAGFIHVHSYGDLYPESNGWLPDDASGFGGWTEM